MEENNDLDPDLDSRCKSSSSVAQQEDALSTESVPDFTFEQGKISFSNRI
jgi:hypothetical protein